ncbi:TRAP transporter small permease subunit [Piscinibacter sakaiensis]|uniref:TRAP transporter small permease subunit n=1 Tax=Piscinibacter sakaiensis TaxID=1547922 RepID=UPI003AAB15B0
MDALLTLARWIDALNDRMADLAKWAVGIACAVSAGNAIARYAFDLGSNALLEMQWYLFAGCVMLGAAQVLRLNEHVRVDVVYAKYPTRGKVLVDLFGMLFFLIPVTTAVLVLAWPVFMRMVESGEMSPNAGGLIRWPVMLMIPLGMALLLLQGISEIIKRSGWLMHCFEMDAHYERPLQ